MVTRAQQRPQAGQPAKDSQPHRARTDEGPGSLAGNLTRDPELRYTPQGKPVVSLRVAVSDRVKDPDTGKWSDAPAEFFDVAAWGDFAERIAEHLSKGQRIVCEGRWESQEWEDPEGKVQTRVVLVARDLGPSLVFRGARVLDGKPNGGA